MEARRNGEAVRSGRRGILPAVLLVWAVFLYAVANTALAREEDAKNAQIAQGSKLFDKECSSCHSVTPEDASPFGPPVLAGLFDNKSKMTPKRAEEIIRKGNGPMPAYGTTLSDEQIDSLLAYLKSLSPSKSAPTQTGAPAQRN